MRSWSSLYIAALAATPLSALELSLPAACTLGETCHILQSADRDPGPGHTDFTCGSLSYDGHTGTDIALPSWVDMEAGIDVLASAPGRVRGMRDGMADRAGYRAPGDELEGRECGNGVLIDHEDGWQTQYCHLRRGSVTVRTGDVVERGQVLGRIGASGQADFPHVHLTVRKNGVVIDPFDGRGIAESCGTSGGSPLWAEGTGVELQPGGLLASGFLGGIPEYADVWNSAPDLARLPPEAGGLVFWAHYYGVRIGDALMIRITGPDGAEIITATHEMERNRATEFRAAGRRTPSEGWPPGRYEATAQLVRDGRIIDETRGQMRIP